MNDVTNSWEAVFLIAEYFCLGGGIFTSNKKVRGVLCVLCIVFAIISAVVW